MYKNSFGNLAFLFLSNCFTLVMHGNHSFAQRPLLAPCLSQNHQQSRAPHLRGTACLHSWLNLRTHLSQLPLSLSPSISGPLDIPNIRLFAFTLPPTVTATSAAASCIFAEGIDVWLNCLRACAMSFSSVYWVFLVQRYLDALEKDTRIKCNRTMKACMHWQAEIMCL